MPRLVIAGSEDTTPRVEFRLEADGGDIDIYANDDLIGSFQVGADGLVSFVAYSPYSYGIFATKDGLLAVR